MDISEQKLDEFQARLSNWVASQGLFFQLTHGGGLRSAHSSIGIWIARMLIRLLILAVIAAAGFWIYLAKRPDFSGFREQLHDRIATATKAETLTMGGVGRRDGHLEISSLELEGSEESFFDNLALRGFKTKMGVLDGTLNTWSGETLTVDHIKLVLKAGAEDDARGGRIFQSLFDESENFKFSRIQLEEASISWGYSGVTQGAIEKAQVRGARAEGGWQFLVTGGTFSQNWLRDLEIQRMEIVIKPDLIEISNAHLKHPSGVGEIGFRVRVDGPPSQPALSGEGSMKSLPFDSFLGTEVGEVVSGSLSGDFTIGGSPYARTGVEVTADIILQGNDRVELRDRLQLFKAISVVDRFRSYKNVRFTSGYFTLVTGNELATFRDINLEAPGIMRLEGEFQARPQTDQEIDLALRMERGESVLQLDEEGNDPGTEEPKELTLADAARMAQQQSIDDKLQGILLSQSSILAKQRFFDEARERQRRLPRLEGEIRIGLHAKAFERAPKLRKRYPVDEKSALRWLTVALDGNLSEVGTRKAEEIYDSSGSGPLAEDPAEEDPVEDEEAEIESADP